MDLRTLLKTIIDSTREDWNFMSGSSFHSTFGREGTSPNDDELHAYSHHAVAAYIPDISISMEWGISWHENYDAGWVHKFPAAHAVGRYLDIFYNHSVVHRVAFVEVDGAKMPNPNNVVDLKVPKGVCDLLKVIDRMGRAERPAHDSYEKDLRRAGFQVTTEDWPKFMH